MKQFLLPMIAVCATIGVQAQSYTLEDLELQFLKNNGELIANKYNIDIADAEIVQEKLWPNPTFAIKEVNLWKTYGYEDKHLSLELEQLIETAKKRKKRIAIKELSKNTALFDYEELLRELRKELRSSYITLARIKQEEVQLNTMVDLFTTLSEQYKRQANLQNVPKAEYFRIQTELIGYQNELIELENEKFETLAQLQILTFNPDITFEQLVFEMDKIDLSSQVPINLLELAKAQNIGLRKQENEIEIANKTLDLEKAQRVPDLMVGANFDKGSRGTRDVIGVGVAFDIPVFNTNKGNIKAAKIAVDQEKMNQFVLENNLIQTVRQLENQLKRLENQLTNWSATNNTEEQLKLIENYKKHLQNKQVNLLEFLDFTEAFREANKAYLQLDQAYKTTFQELQYIVGKDF